MISGLQQKKEEHDNEEAVKLFYQKYPNRKIMDPLDRDSDYWENGSYLFEVGTMKSNELYCCFPW